MARPIHLALVVAGAALLAVLVRAAGVETLATALRGFGPAFVGVVALELVVDACNTLAWRSLLGSERARIGFWRLYWIRQAGTAINQLTPSATVGGELVKASLLRTRIGGTEAFASVVAAKLSFAIAQMTMVMLGLAAILARLEDAPALRAAVLLGCAASCAGIGGFLVVQRRGLLTRTLDVLARCGVGGPRWARLRERAANLDTRLARLHHDEPGAFRASVLWHFAAQVIGTLQLLYVLRALGAPATLITCVAIEAFALIVDSAVFFVPGRIGVQEGGRVVVFTAFGLGATLGLTVALIVRLNQLTVAALGLAAFSYFSVTNAPVTGSITET